MELEYPAEMKQEQPVKSDNDYRSQIMEEAEVETILLGKEEKPTLRLTQAEEAEEAEEGEILETLEEGEIPRTPLQQAQNPQIQTPIE